VPLFGVKDTVVIGISTPLEANNFYSQMLEAKKPDGSPLFKTLEITTLCDACVAAGALECPHKTELPSWKTSERQDLVKQLMTVRSSDMFRREACGIVTKNNRNAFNLSNLERMAALSNRIQMAALGTPKVRALCK
jgi:hypothetical protein